MPHIQSASRDPGTSPAAALGERPTALEFLNSCIQRLPTLRNLFYYLTALIEFRIINCNFSIPMFAFSTDGWMKFWMDEILDGRTDTLKIF